MYVNIDPGGSRNNEGGFIVGGIATDIYWSSSKFGCNGAWAQKFGHGDQRATSLRSNRVECVQFGLFNYLAF